MPVADVLARLAMARRKPNSQIVRSNRRGCFLLAAILLLLIAAMAYIGLHGDPIDDLKSDIPALGP